MGYVLPMIVLHFWELAKVRIDIGGISKSFLSTSIVAKYLNYSAESRLKVDVADVQIGVRENSGELAESYLAVLAILRLNGKLMVMLYFTVQENPRAVHYVMIMTLFMLTFACLRHGVLSDAFELPNDLGVRVQSAVADLAKNYRLIANYHQRPKIQDMFAHKVALWRDALSAPFTVKVNNDFFTQWLGPLFIGVYIMSHARLVLIRELEPGSFIAMMTVLNEMSIDFSEGYKEFMKITSMGGTLRLVTFILNRSTELADWKNVNRRRRQTTQIRRDKIMNDKSGQHPFPTDMLQLEFNNVGFSFQEHTVLSGINLTVPQGLIVAIVGKHGQARHTFLQLIAHELFPTEGEIFIPTHLRILHVSQEVYLTHSNVLQNLTFGHPDADTERIKQILARLDAQKLLREMEKQLETAKERYSPMGSERSSFEADEFDEPWLPCCAAEEPCEEIPEDGAWQGKISYSEKAKLHIARALIMNPEVMVLQRPLAHFNDYQEDCVLQLIHEHVHNRGVGLPPESLHMRRPRTVFISVENEDQAKFADVVWTMNDPSALHSVTVARDVRVPVGVQASVSVGVRI